MPQLIITFKKGTVEMKAIGFRGPGCLDASKPYRDKLGLAGEPELTFEYYEQEGVSEQEQSR